MFSIENYKIVVSLFPSDEADTGSGGDQPARNNLTDWNGLGRNAISPNPFSHSKRLCLRKRFVSVETRRDRKQVLTRKKVNIFWDKTKSKHFGIYRHLGKSL